jgi:hypothetical protein
MNEKLYDKVEPEDRERTRGDQEFEAGGKGKQQIFPSKYSSYGVSGEARKAGKRVRGQRLVSVDDPLASPPKPRHNIKRY